MDSENHINPTKEIKMASIVHLDEVAGVNIRATTNDFVDSLRGCKLPKGTFFSGTVYFTDFPAGSGLVQAEIQGVIGDIIGDMLIDMTLTSVDMTKRWTCSFRTGHGKVQWIER
jgi:hypothetical protein